MDLGGKRVVVIGGTSGIGLGVARAALGDGAEIVVASSSADKLAAMAETLPGAKALSVDVREEASVAALFEQVGTLDHLVFTAGDWAMRGGGPVERVDIAAAAAQLEVRFWGAARAIKHAVPRIRGAGSITLTNGMIAHRPRKGTAVSSAAAGAIEHLARALAVELAPIRVNAVCAGLIRTPVWNMIPEDPREERLQRMTRKLPVARVGEAEEAAQAYLYLMRGGYTTGQVLRVDGGQSAI